MKRLNCLFLLSWGVAYNCGLLSTNYRLLYGGYSGLLSWGTWLSRYSHHPVTVPQHCNGHRTLNEDPRNVTAMECGQWPSYTVPGAQKYIKEWPNTTEKEPLLYILLGSSLRADACFWVKAL